MTWEKEFDERIGEKKFGGRRNDRKATELLQNNRYGRKAKEKQWI